MTNKELYSAMLVITVERAHSALGVGELEPRDIYAEVMENLTTCMRGDSNPNRAIVQIWAERFAHCTACTYFNASDCTCTATYARECELLQNERSEKTYALKNPHDPYVNGLNKEV